jgi:outer membrane protein assembly factor BamC
MFRAIEADTGRGVVIAAVLGALLALSACSTLEEQRKIDYKSTRTLPPLEVPKDLSVPPDLASTPRTDRAPGGSASFSEFSAETAKIKDSKPMLSQPLLPQFSDMQLVESGNQRWLVVKGSPEELWPKLHDFLLTSGLLIAKDDPPSGVIETDWAENRAKIGSGFQQAMAKYLGSVYATGTRDRYRVRLQRGAADGTAEILIAHQGMEEHVYEETNRNARFVWEPRASEPELEVEMLRLLMVHLGTKPEEAAAKVAAIEKRPERAKLTRDEQGRNLLSLDDSLDRVWRRVGLSLDRLGFTVEDRDRSKGVYYVRYIDPDKDSKKSWFESDSKKKDENQYRITVTRAPAGAQVAVLDSAGEPERSKTGERILNLLYEQLR